jgi:hypothetical protein
MEISMALKGQMGQSILRIGFLALDISFLFFLFLPGSTGEVKARSSSFKGFSNNALISEPSPILRRISFMDTVALPVVQQPEGNTNYVSSNDGEVTQFAAAARHGNIGLLAHNYLSGSSFSQLEIGHEIRVDYGDGRSEEFVVTEILRYQALDPKNPYSSFINMENSQETLTVKQMFDRAYLGDHHLTLQTCIAAEGISSWGRLFIIAVPKTESLGMGRYPAQ